MKVKKSITLYLVLIAGPDPLHHPDNRFFPTGSDGDKRYTLSEPHQHSETSMIITITAYFSGRSPPRSHKPEPPS
jgi:hypothetical protein